MELSRISQKMSMRFIFGVGWTQPLKLSSWYTYRIPPCCTLLNTQMGSTYCYLAITALLSFLLTATHVCPLSQTTMQFPLVKSSRELTMQDNCIIPSDIRHNESSRPSWIMDPSLTVLSPKRMHNVQTSFMDLTLPT